MKRTMVLGALVGAVGIGGVAAAAGNGTAEPATVPAVQAVQVVDDTVVVDDSTTTDTPPARPEGRPDHAGGGQGCPGMDGSGGADDSASSGSTAADSSDDTATVTPDVTSDTTVDAGSL